MNSIMMTLLRGKLSSFLRAERFTGYRTYLCVGIYLLALAGQVIGIQFGLDPNLQEILEIVKQAAVGAGGLALAAKVDRKVNGKKRKTVKRKKRPTDRVKGGK